MNNDTNPMDDAARCAAVCMPDMTAPGARKLMEWFVKWYPKAGYKRLSRLMVERYREAEDGLAE